MYKLVPVEATEEMIKAGCAVTCRECHMDCNRGPTGKIYRTMLDAAPNPWRPIAEAPKDGTYILARKANPKKGCRPAAVIQYMHGRWGDAWAQYHPYMFDGFIPLEWLGSPEEK